MITKNNPPLLRELKFIAGVDEVGWRQRMPQWSSSCRCRDFTWRIQRSTNKGQQNNKESKEERGASKIDYG